MLATPIYLGGIVCRAIVLGYQLRPCCINLLNGSNRETFINSYGQNLLITHCLCQNSGEKIGQNFNKIYKDIKFQRPQFIKLVKVFNENVVIVHRKK